VKGTGTPPWVILPLTVIQSRSLRRRSFTDFGFRVATLVSTYWLIIPASLPFIALLLLCPF
jgi:hypothetical protein